MSHMLCILLELWGKWGQKRLLEVMQSNPVLKTSPSKPSQTIWSHLFLQTFKVEDFMTSLSSLFPCLSQWFSSFFRLKAFLIRPLEHANFSFHPFFRLWKIIEKFYCCKEHKNTKTGQNVFYIMDSQGCDHHFAHPWPSS